MLGRVLFGKDEILMKWQSCNQERRCSLQSGCDGVRVWIDEKCGKPNMHPWMQYASRMMKTEIGRLHQLCGFYHSIHYLTWQLRSDFIRSSSHGARSHDPGRELLQVAPRRRWWDWIIPWIVVFQPGWSQVLKIQWTMSCYKWLKRTLVSNHLINLDDQEIYVYLCIYISQLYSH